MKAEESFAGTSLRARRPHPLRQPVPQLDTPEWPVGPPVRPVFRRRDWKFCWIRNNIYPPISPGAAVVFPADWSACTICIFEFDEVAAAKFLGYPPADFFAIIRAWTRGRTTPCAPSRCSARNPASGPVEKMKMISFVWNGDPWNLFRLLGDAEKPRALGGAARHAYRRGLSEVAEVRCEDLPVHEDRQWR